MRSLADDFGRRRIDEKKKGNNTRCHPDDVSTIAVLGTTIMAIVMSKARQTNDLKSAHRPTSSRDPVPRLPGNIFKGLIWQTKNIFCTVTCQAPMRDASFSFSIRTTRANGRPVSRKTGSLQENKMVWPTKRS